MRGQETPLIKGILLLYHHPLHQGAYTIMEHVNAFEQHSQFNVWKVNVELGFPEGLNEIDFSVLVLHYSLFGIWPYMLGEKFLNYIQQSQAYKIAFFQDEYRFCQARFDFIKRYHIDCIYTLIEPQYFSSVYSKYTNAKKLIYTLPGYVSEDLISVATTLTKSEKERSVDIGYRGRQLPAYMGKGAQEKYEIATRFKKEADALNLKNDIETEEKRRIYGKRWLKFLSGCKAVLGVEAGVSIFDIEDRARVACERMISKNPANSIEEISKVLQPWEGNIPYRMISPRHFEAAALRVCQILFEGYYSGILFPMVHYIPLRKDFSNVEEVVKMFRDKRLRSELTETAYRDLIHSKKYSYHEFIKNFDQELMNIGIQVGPEDKGFRENVDKLLRKNHLGRYLMAKLKSLGDVPFPGRQVIKWVLKPDTR